MTKRQLRRSLFATSLVLAIAPACLRAQQPAKAEFDVAAIKPNKAGDGRVSIRNSSGLWRAENITVKSLLQNAFEVLPDQISGAPAWVDSERYDIEAKFEEDPKLSHLENNQRNRLRLQALLAGRFQLQVHRETKQWAVYALVAGKKGPKLQPTSRKEGGSSMRQSNGRLEANGITMENLARNLEGSLDRPVVDQTGIEGRFDVTLEFEPDSQASGGDIGKAAAPGPAAPSLFTALQDQLGLKLESKKAPVEILVIDRISRPSEN